MGGNTTARDPTGIAKYIRTDTDGKVVLGANTADIGKVQITDGTETANVNASNQLEVSVENAVTVSATDLDIRNLAPATDEVKIGDGTETASVNDQDILETSPEHSLKGKTILYNRTDVTNGAATLRTVTAGKTYYLLQAALSYYATAGNKTALMFIGTSASILFRMNSTITPTYHTADRDTLIFVYPHPIPIAAGTAIQIDSSDAGLKADGWIMGWEE